MATTIEYALMAGASYISTRGDKNQFPIPDGWDITKHANPDDGSGFEAISFIQEGATLATSNEIVISYAGTNTSNYLDPDWAANIGLGTGAGSDQLLQAAEYYLEIKASAPEGATITLTGHSLGGGLAALIAVFFGVEAHTFDQAPFAASATEIIRDQLVVDLLASGYTREQLAVLAPTLMAAVTSYHNVFERKAA